MFVSLRSSFVVSLGSDGCSGDGYKATGAVPEPSSGERPAEKCRGTAPTGEGESTERARIPEHPAHKSADNTGELSFRMNKGCTEDL